MVASTQSSVLNSCECGKCGGSASIILADRLLYMEIRSRRSDPVILSAVLILDGVDIADVLSAKLVSPPR